MLIIQGAWFDVYEINVLSVGHKIYAWAVVPMKIILTQIILIWPRKEAAGWQKQYMKN